MKTRIYLRVAKGANDDRIAANVRPSYEPLSETRRGKMHTLPTAYFALDVVVPEDVLKRAEQVAATVTLDAQDGQVIVKPIVESAPSTPGGTN